MSQIELYTLCPVFQIERWHRLVQLTTTHIVQKCLKLNSTPCVQCGLFWKVNVSQSHGWDGTRPGNIYQSQVDSHTHTHTHTHTHMYSYLYVYPGHVMGSLNQYNPPPEACMHIQDTWCSCAICISRTRDVLAKSVQRASGGGTCLERWPLSRWSIHRSLLTLK